MSELMIPGPPEPEKTVHKQPKTEGHKQAQAEGQERADAGGGGTAADHGQSRNGRGNKAAVPSEEECLQAIAQTGRLAALGLLKPAVANAIRNSFRDILQHYQRRAKESEQTAVDGALLESLRNDPKLLNLMEPILSQEQIDRIIHDTY